MNELTNVTLLEEEKNLLRRCYWNMRTRCENKNYRDFHRYGGRGIKVCDDWKTRSNFVQWALSTGYRKGLTLERVDNNQGYSPKNCRWATLREQENNRSNNRRVTFEGVTKTMSQWAYEIGVKPGTLWWRLKEGWEVSRALNKV